MMDPKQIKPVGYLHSVFSCNCPRCRRGKLFRNGISISSKKNMDMNETCPVCGLSTEKEPGFYFGTAYVSYALTIAISFFSLLLWWLLIGFSTEDNRFFIWMGCNAILLLLLQPWLIRLSRSIWISWFVKFDPEI